jgi:hypothetical protein
MNKLIVFFLSLTTSALALAGIVPGGQPPVPVPEPDVFALLGIGVAAIAYVKWSKRNKK